MRFSLSQGVKEVFNPEEMNRWTSKGKISRRACGFLHLFLFVVLLEVQF